MTSISISVMLMTDADRGAVSNRRHLPEDLAGTEHGEDEFLPVR